MESKLNFVSLLEGTKEGIASNLRLLIYMLILHFVEAAYASSLRRARIPLLVDPDYTAEGWLALMTAGDYHYDFVRKPFETKIVELIQELERRCVPSGEDKMDGITKQESVTKQPDAHVTSSHGHPTYSVPSAHGQNREPASAVQSETTCCRKHAKRWKVGFSLLPLIFFIDYHLIYQF